MRLLNAAAVVTGGASGLGAAVARAFAREGARVAVIDVNDDGAASVVEDCPQGVAIHADVSDPRMVEEAFGRIGETYGRVDILANVAGVTDTGERDRHLSELRMQQRREVATRGRIDTPLDATISMSDADWNRVIAINLSGTFHCIRSALPLMIPQRRGAIINTSSVVGLSGYAGSPHYTASKAGVLGLTRAVAREVIVQGIRVNAVVPGAMDTPMNQRMPAEMRTSAGAPIGRQATAEEVAGVFVFLASDESSYIVGESIIVDGGQSTM